MIREVQETPYEKRIPLSRLAEGHAPKPLVSAVRKRGDAFFNSPISLEEAAPHLPKLPKGYYYSDYSGVLLKVRNVPPHEDDAVGVLSQCWVGTVFGLLHTAGECFLQVGNQSLELRKGDWVMFDDRLVHSLISDRQCLGVSFQIGTAERDPQDGD